MNAFDVGQRVYWSRRRDGWPFLFAIEGGIVVTSGPAISSVWIDDCVFGEQPRMATMANDRISTDHDEVVRNAAKVNDEIRAYREEDKRRERAMFERRAAVQDAEPPKPPRTYPNIGTEDIPFPFSKLFRRRK